jgi:CRP-like cAMP-binding protein
MPPILPACRHLPTLAFDAGEIVIAEGTPSGELFILATGAAEVVKGDVQIVTVTEPGALFGEMSILLETPHTATVRALEPSTFYVAADPLGFLHANPEIAFELSRLLARRLNFVNGYLVDLKRQFEGSGDHLAMVDEVLESLVHHQGRAAGGSARCPEPDPTTK